MRSTRPPLAGIQGKAVTMPRAAARTKVACRALKTVAAA